MFLRRSLASAVLLATITGSCVSRPTAVDRAPLPNEPLSMQLPRVEPALRGLRYSVLMDFESERDLVFLNSPTERRTTEIHRHTGLRSLILPEGQMCGVKLSSLMRGREFPGSYLLAGCYVKSPRAAQIRLRCVAAGARPLERIIDLPSNTWTATWIDLTEFPGGSDARLEIHAPSETSLWCDDVMVLDNRAEFLPPSDTGLNLWRAGLKFYGGRQGHFSFTLDSSEGFPAGWTPVEISPHRILFQSGGKTRNLTVYADGRSYWDGEFRGLSAATRDDPAYARQHQRPAVLTVPEELGRLVRNSPGDANNDGYNEQRGCYMVQADGSRLQIDFKPQTSPLPSPVIEISGLPPGKVLVHVDGHLVNTIERQPDGRTLVLLPLKISRAASMSCRIE